MTPNYDLAVKESINTLNEYGFNSIPINLDIIFTELKRTIKKCSYSKFSIQSGLSIDEICEYFESDLGACVYDRSRERYVIYYNDTKLNPALDRFTIAHELGHFFLNHYEYVDTDILLRKPLSEKKYKKFENEANCFARNLLAPVPLVNRVTNIKSTNSTTDIMNAFDVSFKAAKARLDFYKVDNYRMTADYYTYFNTYTISYGYYCLNCKNSEVDNSKHCKICGQGYSVFEKGVDRVLYDGLELDSNMKLKVCPKCLNSYFSENEDKCNICGQYLFNDCSNDFCGITKLSGNTRCCPECGSDTTFVYSGILKNWEDSLIFQLNKLEFESDLCGKYGKSIEIDDWSFFVFELKNNNKEYISKLLEHTTAKLCGSTLIIYAPNPIIKEKLDNQYILEIIMDNLEPEFSIKADNIEIACIEDFYPKHSATIDKIDDSDIPF
jgi:hypothetical protein